MSISPDTRLWIITDGKAGDIAPCLGIADWLGLTPILKTVAPRARYTLFPFLQRFGWGGVDPKEAPDAPDSSLAPPFADIIIASGRRSIPYLQAIKRASQGRCFTVFLKNPRIGARAADFIWMPAHDRIGKNHRQEAPAHEADTLFMTLTSPHRITPRALEAGLATHPAWGVRQPEQRLIALLLGGDSKHFRYTNTDEARLCAGLEKLMRQGNTRLVVTPSRRTPNGLAQRVAALVEAHGGWFWHQQGENPYLALLAQADALIVTADSVNMVGEALATAKPVYVFRPSGDSRKIDWFLAQLEARGFIRPFPPLTQDIEHFLYAAIDSTPEIAAELIRCYHRFRATTPSPERS